MTQFRSWLEARLVAGGYDETVAAAVAQVVLMFGVAALAILVNFVAKRVILGGVRSFVSHTQVRWDDAILEHHVFDRLSHLAPAVVLYAAAEPVFPENASLQSLVRHLALAYTVLVGAWSFDGLLSAVVAIYQRLEVAKTRPILSYVQVVRIVVYVITAILVIATLTDRSPWGLLSGLGAMTAILMLVFKDTILGLVASVQVTAYDMVRVGDWIEMPKYGANGDVLEVTLNTVKVQNWDKTISTIPTYALVSEPVKNWRGMSESGGRRIKRALWIDQTSVKFCSDAMLDRFERYDLLRDYVRERRKQIADENAERKVDVSQAVNGRRMTNFGTFRAYVIAYLRNHPKIRADMTFLVRQLAPGPTGIGLEIYVFSNDQVWANYESIQADIFDHLLAALPEFELRVFQNPTGADVQALAGKLRLAGSPPT